MGFLDKAKDLVGKNSEKVDSAVQKAGDAFDERTDGKFAQYTDTVQEKAGEFLTGGSKDNSSAEDPSQD